MTSDLSSVGMKILDSARAELYMNMPYLSEALYALKLENGDHVTVSAATDGMTLYFSGSFVSDKYMRSQFLTDRLYLHVILHCMLRHIGKKRGKNSVLWDLACDAAVESILDALPYRCLQGKQNPAAQMFYGECRREMKVLTAEGIYRMLLRKQPSEYETARLQHIFMEDDHGLWDMDQNDDSESESQDDKWKNIASRTQTGMETVLSREANGGEAVLEQVSVSSRDDVDYRAFLKRFAAPREILKTDDDSFDYIYYSYGLRHYGNMPLVEPLETKEEKRIEDLVIAIDTSMSTSGELVREFLKCTYTILRSTETFTKKLNIHVIQCDNEIRSDVRISDMAELESYMRSVELCGGSATDFRPVFDYIAELKKKGTFASLRGLIYFTDGMGIYPSKRPDYETAFVLLEEPPLSYKMPPWCIRIVLAWDSLEKAAEELQEDWEDEREELPIL